MRTRTISEAEGASLGAQINLTAKAFAAALAAALPAGLTTSQVEVLSHLSRHPLTSQRDVAAATAVDPATLAEMLRRLERRGIVRREPDPADARRMLVSIDRLDPETLKAAIRAADDVNTRALAVFSKAERHALIPLLTRLRANLGSDRASHHDRYRSLNDRHDNPHEEPVMTARLLYRGPAVHTLAGYARAHHVEPDAPISVTATVTIDAPVARVWEVLTDVIHWSDSLEPGVTKVHLPKGVQVGAPFRRTNQGFTMTSRFEVVEPERELVWTGSALGVRAVHRFDLAALDTQYTRLSTEESMGGRPLAVLCSSAKLREQLNSSLQSLKAACEK